MRLQFSSLSRHYGTRSRSVNGSEHWRYGAFVHRIRNIKHPAELERLMVVAQDDPDESMAKAMIKEVVSHPLAPANLASSNNALKGRRAKRAPLTRA